MISYSNNYNLITICLFIIYFCNNNLINGQLIRLNADNPLKLETIKTPIFTTYPSISTDTYCNFEIEVSQSTTDVTDTADTLTSSNDLIGSCSNYFRQVYTVGSVGSVTMGNSVIFNLNGASTLYTSIYQVNFTCLAYDYSSIKVNIIGDPHYTLGYISIIKIEGLGNHIFNELANNPTVGTFAPIKSSDFYYIIWDIDYIASNPLNSNWSDTITIGDQFYPITTRSYYYEELPTTLISHLVIPNNYVNVSNVFEEFGLNCEPIFTSTYNSEYTRPFDFLYIPKNSYPSTPIKGNKFDITYQFYFMDVFGYDGTPKDSQTYTQNGLTSTLTTYTMSIKKHYPPSLIGTPITLNSMSSPIIAFSASFTQTNFKFQEFYYESYLKSFNQGFPFGFVSGTNSNYNHKVVFSRVLETCLSDPTYIINTVGTYGNVITNLPYTQITSNDIPVITYYEIIPITGLQCLVKLNIKTPIGLSYIIMDSPNGIKRLETLVNGTIYDGMYEFMVTTYNFQQLSYVLYDLQGNNVVYGIEGILSYSPFVEFKIPPFFKYQVGLDSFNNITFIQNDLNLLNTTGYTILELTSSSIPIDITMGVLLLDPLSFDINNFDISNALPLDYDPSSGTFKSKMVLKKNNIFDEIQYIITVTPEATIFSDTLPKIKVSNTYLDNQGPLFLSIERVNSGVTLTNLNNKVGWKINIVDDFNGFESGYVKVMGSIDSSKYEFNFTASNLVSGDIWNGIYELLVDIDYQNCVSQELVITDIILMDTNNIASQFHTYSSFKTLNGSPLQLLYPGGSDILGASYTCASSNLDTSVPNLKSFNFIFNGVQSPSSIDVGLTNRIMVFNFEIQLSTSGIKDKQMPIVYMVSSTMDSLKCVSTLVGKTSTLASFNCSIELPVAFGYVGDILFSVYGYINNGGNYYGWSTEELINLGLDYHVGTSLSTIYPVITSVGKFYSDDTSLIIYGRGLADTTVVYVRYNTTVGSIPDLALTVSHSDVHSSVIKVKSVRPASKPFIISIYSGPFQSNDYLVVPIYFDIANTPTQEPTTTPTPTPTQTTTPSQTPTASIIPTNPPQKCLGKPECGGKNQGYCSSSGCVCISPWIGNDCTSKIIIVPPPVINNTSPSTSIPTNGGGSTTGTTSTTGSLSSSSSSTEEIFYKSLISLVSLRELDFKNVQVNNIIFDQWTFTGLSEFKNQYFTSFKASKTSDTITNITVTLEWFNTTSFIEFANQNLTMNPSSIKYTINISNYPFLSQLNQLQLIMSAEFQSNKVDDVCLVNDFGDTSNGNDNSNYLKIQIQDHSLYGRFIKRAIIDGLVTSIENKLLDSTFNEINDKESKSQTFIGITIPHYNVEITVDPDFSVIIDSNSASNDGNSQTSNTICSGNGKSGLTTSQLAGIIIGSVAFAIVIVVVVVYSILKTKNQKKFIKGMNHKMSNIQ